MKQCSHQQTVMQIAQAVWNYAKRHWSWSDCMKFAWKQYKANQQLPCGKIMKCYPAAQETLVAIIMRVSYRIIREDIRKARKQMEDDQKPSFVGRMVKKVSEGVNGLKVEAFGIGATFGAYALF